MPAALSETVGFPMSRSINGVFQFSPWLSVCWSGHFIFQYLNEFIWLFLTNKSEILLISNDFIFYIVTALNTENAEPQRGHGDGFVKHPQSAPSLRSNVTPWHHMDWPPYTETLWPDGWHAFTVSKALSPVTTTQRTVYVHNDWRRICQKPSGRADLDLSGRV